MSALYSSTRRIGARDRMDRATRAATAAASERRARDATRRVRSASRRGRARTWPLGISMPKNCGMMRRACGRSGTEWRPTVGAAATRRRHLKTRSRSVLPRALSSLTSADACALSLTGHDAAHALHGTPEMIVSAAASAARLHVAPRSRPTRARTTTTGPRTTRARRRAPAKNLARDVSRFSSSETEERKYSSYGDAPDVEPITRANQTVVTPSPTDPNCASDWWKDAVVYQARAFDVQKVSASFRKSKPNPSPSPSPRPRPHPSTPRPDPPDLPRSLRPDPSG